MQALLALHTGASSVRPTPIEPQTPLEPLPFLAALQAWQVPVQALLQQKPSTQATLGSSQTRQPAPWQSAPAALLHAAPGALRGWQVPPDAQ